MDSLVLETANREIDSIDLTDNYRKRKFKNNFSTHLDGLVDIAMRINGDDDFILKGNFELTKQLYWEIEAFVLENIDDVHNDDVLASLEELEDRVRGKIVRNLGVYYENIPEINDIIDYSVNGFLMSSKFDCMDAANSFINPWSTSKAVLTENGVLHSFYTDSDYLDDLGINTRSNSSSELTKHRIGVVAKGKRDSFTGGMIRDLYGLRNHLFNVIEEAAPSSSNPITTDEIVLRLRSEGLTEDEFSYNQIKNWLILPLKSSGKIGSSTEGYFKMNDCEDLRVTYISHLENFKGYLRTIERYRQIANSKNCDDYFLSSSGVNPFESHIETMRLLLRQFDGNNG